jgi:hypothetical protein
MHEGTLLTRRLLGQTLPLLAAGMMALVWASPLNAQTSAAPTSRAVNVDQGEPPALTVSEARDLINLLPIVMELRAKGTAVGSEANTVPNMNNGEYYFFYVYNVKLAQQHDPSQGIGNYAVNKHTADIRVWEVSNDVFLGNDGVLVTSNELEQLQEDLRKKYGIDPTLVQKYRPAHLAARVVPREVANSAVALPIKEQSANTAELSCWKGRDSFGSRQARSAVISSAAGDRVYAEVKAIALRPEFEETYSGDLCENSVKLFLAKGRVSSFQLLLGSNSPTNDCLKIEGRNLCDVNGIQLVDWSRDGRLLLANLAIWRYENDGGILRLPVIYDVRENKFAQPDLYHFFDQYYKTDAYEEKKDPASTHCDYELLTEGFSPEGDLVLSATRPPPYPDGDEPVFCFDGKQTFLFELAANKITRLASNYKVQHYGTSSSLALHSR